MICSCDRSRQLLIGSFCFESDVLKAPVMWAHTKPTLRRSYPLRSDRLSQLTIQSPAMLNLICRGVFTFVSLPLIWSFSFLQPTVIQDITKFKRSLPLFPLIQSHVNLMAAKLWAKPAGRHSREARRAAPAIRKTFIWLSLHQCLFAWMHVECGCVHV